MFGLTIDLPSGLGTDDAAASERADTLDRGERARSQEPTGGEAASHEGVRSDGCGTLRGDEPSAVRGDEHRRVRGEHDRVREEQRYEERMGVDDSVRLFVAWVACWAGA